MNTFRRVKDGHPVALALYKRHYSCKPNKEDDRFIGPGARVVLLTLDGRALIVWRKFIDDCIDSRTGQKQQGVNCAVFRNEGTTLRSSELLREAQVIARQWWPGQRLYTYVDSSKVKSENPGCCFKKAGWRTCGHTKGGLVILENIGEEVAHA